MANTTFAAPSPTNSASHPGGIVSMSMATTLSDLNLHSINFLLPTYLPIHYSFHSRDRVVLLVVDPFKLSLCIGVCTGVTSIRP